EVEAQTAVTVTGLGIVANVGTYTGVQIWYRPGGVQHIPNTAPNVTAANGWILAGTAGFNSTSGTAITQIPFLLNIPIAANQRMGFMINNPTSAPNTFVYTTGTGPL
ncbi:hypothetical protein RZS08_58445, partial [Arthrospira platensis SPKY1]|nr:hypothetical protein [Arthrospira platensis SPKY1]